MGVRIGQTRRLWLLTLAAVTACAPTSPVTEGGGKASAPQDGAARTIVLAQSNPVASFGPWQFGNTSGGAGSLVEIHTTGLTTEDGHGNLVPRVAAALPSLQDGSIVIPPDGRMQTTWRLRPDATWQDGAPFTSDDVAFSFAANTDLPGAVSGEGAVSFIERIDTPDRYTAVITWKTTYYKALELTHRSFWLYPKHLLGQEFTANKENTLNHPYFTSEYVHLGPFRLVDWGLGEDMVFERYDGYFLGRPKVGKIVIRVIGDPNTMLAALRAGAVDIVPAKTMPNHVYPELADEWNRVEEGVVVRHSENWRYIWFQLDPRWAQPIEISQDVRFRRGFLFGLDRDAVRDLIYPGIPEAASDSFLATSDSRGSIVGQPFARYSYDPNRALQEWGDAGWRRAADGRILNSAGQPVQAELRATQPDATQIAAIAAGWRQLGLDVPEYVVPPSRLNDGEFRATMPALESRGGGQAEGIFPPFDGRRGKTPESRWAGSSNGHYANPAFDRLIDRLYETTDAVERGYIMKDMGDIMATDLPAIPIYFNILFLSIRNTIKGPLGDDFAGMSDVSGGATARSAHLWDRT